MKTVKFKLRPLTPFGTPLAGDTLFGHLCWALRERYGEARLTAALDGYTGGRPFLAVSDAFPAGYVPRPAVPDSALGIVADPRQRKTARKRNWLPSSLAALPLREWLAAAERCDVDKTGVLTQNTINRLTGTTGTGMFAPRQVDLMAFAQGAQLDVYAVLDGEHVTGDALRSLLEDVGAMGYGRDATIGLGKFAVESFSEIAGPANATRHWMTLAPCAPVPESLDSSGCFYHPLTRFGRHGNIGVRLGQPFKRPVLLLRTGALIALRQPATIRVHGRGLGGSAAPLSAVIPQTVHQGYAPVIPIELEAER